LNISTDRIVADITSGKTEYCSLQMVDVCIGFYIFLRKNYLDFCF